MKPGRNDPCNCGSGNKFKHCCEGKVAPLPQVPSPAEIKQLVALFNAGRYVELESRASLLVGQYPDFGFGWKLLGGALQMQGKDALSAFQKVAELMPDDAEAHYNLGVALKSLGQLDGAVVSYRRALKLKPDSAEAHSNLGNSLKDLGQLDDAVVSYRRALQIKPDSAEAHNNLGTALKDLGQLEDAVTSYRLAVKINPNYADAHKNLGAVLKDIGQYEGALENYRRVLELKPGSAEAHFNVGVALKSLGKLDAAVASYRRAVEIKPDFAEAHTNLGTIMQILGQLDGAVSSYRRALELEPDYIDAQSNLLFILNFIASHAPSYCLAEARLYDRMVAKKAEARFSVWQYVAKPERLRVGMISGDLNNHPVGYFLENLLMQLDCTRIELIAYPTSPAMDELTTRIKPYFSAWKPLSGLSDETAVRMIHADGVHILIDLAGHTAHNRLPVFAWKPSPVQTSWLGYFATTRVTEMDYMLADPYVAPNGEEDNFTETIWRLPESYLCFTKPTHDVDVFLLPALSIGHITFGCFNNLVKMNDAVVALWIRVLQAVPGSRLFLKTNQLNDSLVCETIRQRFIERGLSPDRLMLEGSSPRAELLAAYRKVDIALDPFPYPGGTTSVEALWMGVPVITRRGERSLSHVGETIAHNAGLADWIATDDDEYIAKAVEHSADLERLAALRAGLRQHVLASPVFDAPRFARNFETALWGMWQTWCDEQQKGKA